MAEEPLVSDLSDGRREPLIDQGASLLRLLDEHGIPITAAFWLFDPESQSWKYMLASPVVTTEGPLKLYRILQEYVGQAGLDLLDIIVVGPHERLVDLLRVVAKTTPTCVTGIRINENAVNNVFIHDTYIYRVA